MKNLLILLPLLTLAAVVFHQATRPASPAPGSPAASQSGADWRGITAELESENLGGRVDEASAYGRYLHSLEMMDGPALIVAWDNLKSAHLPAPVRERLEPSVLGILIRKDAELAMARFANHVGDPPGGIGSLLFGGFRDLAGRLPFKAAQWMDQNVEAGTFGSAGEPKLTGGIPVRVIYERELIRSLLGNGTEQASARLEAMPEEWRVMTLQGADSPQGQAGHARLVRKFMSPDQQLREFSRMAASAAYHGGTDGMTQLMDRIVATKEEREAIIRQTPVLPGNR